MPKVLEKPQYTAARGYQGFPLRSSLQFSSALGQLLPVWWHYLQPGDKVNCSSLITTRSTPLNSSAFVDIAEHIEWFFVPMEQMYKLFQQVLYGVEDIHSNIFDVASVSDTYPHTDTKQILSGLFTQMYNNSFKYDEFGYQTSANSVRLMELLGYDIVPLLNACRYGNWNYDDMPSDSVIARSLWSLLAYQKIYHTHYRLTDRESNNPQAYNVDSFYENDLVSDVKLINIFRMHYRPIRKDFFHGGFVSPLIGSGNIGMLDSFNSGNANFTSSFFRNYLNGNDISESVGSEGNTTVTSPTTVNFYGGDANLSGLRQSFALEKLLEITRRAGKHIDAQTLAHFGVKVPQGIANEAYYLGSHDSEVVIGDVIATAGTESDPLGQVKGKAYNKSKHKDVVGFEAKTHGVLMAIYSSDVPLHYSPRNCDRLNTYVKPTDFYMPEFDDLGMQPIFTYQGYMAYDWTGDAIDPTVYNRNAIRDWTYRYWELKLKYNRTCGAMSDFGNLKQWTIQRDGYNYNDISPTGHSLGLSNYLVDPSFLDDIMLVSYNTYFQSNKQTSEQKDYYNMASTWYDGIYATDPLFHDLFIDVELASKMSTFGLPSL